MGDTQKRYTAEVAVLGCMIIDPQCISQVLERLDAEDFCYTRHQMIFKALIVLGTEGEGHALDAVLLRNELEKRGQLEAIGGVEYIAKIMESVPSSANIITYVGIVRDEP